MTEKQKARLHVILSVRYCIVYILYKVPHALFLIVLEGHEHMLNGGVLFRKYYS